MSEGHAGAAAGGHPDGVHAATEEEPSGLRRLAEQEGAVGGKAFGPVQQHLHLRSLERGKPMQGVHHHRLEVVPVLRKQLEGKIFAERVGIDGLGVRLEAADQQPARIVSDIEMAVVVRQRRHVAFDAVDGPGEQVEVLAWPDRDLDAGHGGHLAAPQAGAERDGVAAHRTPVRLDAGDATAPGQNAGDGGVLPDSCSSRPGSFHEGGAEIGRADPAVIGGPDRADNVVRVHQRPDLLRLVRRNGPGANAEQMRQRLLASDVDEPILGGGDRQRSLVDPAGRLSGLLLQSGVERDRMADEIGEIAGRAKRTHLGCGMPSGAGGQFVAFQQNGIGDAHLGQVVEGRATHDTSADDDDGGVGGKVVPRHQAPLVHRAR